MPENLPEFNVSNKPINNPRPDASPYSREKLKIKDATGGKPKSFMNAEKLPPSEAIKFFRSLENIPTAKWGEISSQAYSKSFAVAGAMEEALLNGFRKAVKKALENGTTLKEFRDDFDKLVKKHGWDYHGSRNWRSKLIYSTNLAAAYSSGKYQKLTTPVAQKMFPYWRYTHHACANPRKEHQEWDGLILKNDDPWWHTHFPPNGWGCHCTVEPVSSYDMETENLKPSVAPPLDEFDWENPATGRIEKIPKGIDPGFQTNVGREWELEAKRKAEKGTVLKPKTYSSSGKKEDVIKAQSKDIRTLLKPNSSGMVTAGTLPATIQKILGSETAEVILSKETLEKQRIEHPEVTEEDYTHLPEMLMKINYAFPSSKKLHLLLGAKLNDKFFKIAMKTTQDKKENFLLSFLLLSKEHWDQLIRNSKNIAEENGA